MDSFATTIADATKALMIGSLSEQMNNFADLLMKNIKEKKGHEWKQEELVSMWNSISTDFSVKGSSKSASCSEEQCEHVYQKEPRNGERCDGKIYEKSETQKYCVKHYKADEKPKKPKVVVPNDCVCEYIKKSGEEVGEPCGKKVTAASKTKKYCSKHISEEKIKVPKAETLTTFFNPKKLDTVPEKDLKKKMNEVLKECMKEYSIIGVYTLETNMPKFYKKYETYIEDFLSKTLDDEDSEHSAIITQFKDEQEKEQEKKEKKKKAKKAKSESDSDSNDSTKKKTKKEKTKSEKIKETMKKEKAKKEKLEKQQEDERDEEDEVEDQRDSLEVEEDQVDEPEFECQDYSEYFDHTPSDDLEKNMALGFVKWMKKHPEEDRGCDFVVKLWIENDMKGDREFCEKITEIHGFCAKVVELYEEEKNKDKKCEIVRKKKSGSS